MSKEKLYAVKNDEGKYWNFEDQDGFWKLSTVLLAAFTDEESAKSLAHDHGGHVVTLIEEPKKVVISKEQAEIVKRAHIKAFPATFIYNSNEKDEELLMNAYVNGYTVAKEKRYLVYLDGLVTTDGAKQYLTKKDGKWFASRRMPGLYQGFTEDELKTAPELAQKLDRVEVTDNEL